MRCTETLEWQAALGDFALTSGHLVLIELSSDGQILDYNSGFKIAVRPVGEANGHSLAEYFPGADGESPDIVPGLPGGAPVPYALRTWVGDEIIFYAYPLPEDRTLLVGTLASPTESQVIQRMARLTTEMSQLVRDLRRANRRNDELAHTDPLTGLPNRRCFLERLKQVLEHAEHHRQPATLLMMDLDRFKQVNDRFGHAGGDSVLQSFADQIRQGARVGDLPGRLGGEEFALLLPDTGLEPGRLVAERIRRGTATSRPLGPDEDFSVSIGVAVSSASESCDSLMRRADTALYEAKAAGRNRVEVA